MPSNSTSASLGAPPCTPGVTTGGTGLWHPHQLPPCTPQAAGDGTPWGSLLLTLLDSPSIASKRWIYRQYDHQVQNNTVILPGGADAAVVRLRPQGSTQNQALWKGVAATTDCNPRYVYLHPYEGAKMAVAEAARNLSCVGAQPLAVTDNLNFGSPENPTGYWQLAEACRGLAEACREFQTPVTGGNVSLYNETLDSEGNPQPIYPTPVVGMVGLLEDVSRACGQGWQTVGDGIYLLGCPLDQPTPQVTLGGSEYLAVIHGQVTGMPPLVDFDRERQVQGVCRWGIAQGWIRSAHDLAEGGLGVALAESCLGGDRGATVEIPQPQGDLRWDTVLFGEGGSRILVSVDPAHQGAWEAHLQTHLGGLWQRLGTVTPGESGLRLHTPEGAEILAVSLGELRGTWEGAIDRRLS